MTQANNYTNNRKGMMSCLKLRWQCKVVFFALTTFITIMFSKVALAADITVPDTVPDWYPAETCMEMMDILIDEYSLTPEGAASVLGNVCQESKYQGTANSGYYIGICQWDPYYRWPMISDWLTNHGYSTDSAIGQLHAAFNNAENGQYSDTINYMKSVTSIEDGVHRWLVYYEGAPGQQEAERISYAYNALEIYNHNK